jgi:hypothetical protein
VHPQVKFIFSALLLILFLNYSQLLKYIISFMVFSKLSDNYHQSMRTSHISEFVCGHYRFVSKLIVGTIYKSIYIICSHWPIDIYFKLWRNRVDIIFFYTTITFFFLSNSLIVTIIFILISINRAYTLLNGLVRYIF